VERPSAPGSWRRYVSGDPVHDLANARGHDWLATCVPVEDVLSQGILSSSISGCLKEALHVTAINFCLSRVNFSHFIYPSTCRRA